MQSAREGGHLFVAAAGNMGSSTLSATSQALSWAVDDLSNYILFCFLPGVLCRQI